jgi:hypothetical protein
MTTAQETFDALSTILTEKEIVDMLVDKAIGFLEYDDDHPDVGMGMFVVSAIDLAAKEVREEAQRWKRKVFISDSAIKLAADIVRKKRAR